MYTPAYAALLHKPFFLYPGLPPLPYLEGYSPLLMNKKSTMPAFSIPSHWCMVILSLYFGSVLNLSFWRFVLAHIGPSSPHSFVFALSLILMMFIAGYMVMALVFVPYLGKPLVALLLCLSSVANYMMFQYGIYIDSDMVRNVFETHPREALDLASPNTVIWFVATGLVPALLLLRTRIRYKSFGGELRFRLLSLLLCVLAVAGMAAITYKDYAAYGRNNRQARKLINTGNYIYANIRYFQKQVESKRPFQLLDPGVLHKPLADSAFTVFVLVLGETARAQNFSLNGYERETNPQLALEDIINYPDMSACGTATATSVPCMFSPLPRVEYTHEAGAFTESFVDMASQAGYSVLWRENDGGCKGVCDRVTVEDMVALNNPQFCKDGSCLDEVLLEGLEEKLRSITGDTFIILHTMGSHGPTYFKRYPEAFKRFTPTCDTADIQNCPQEAIINTYDNTILYTDHIVASAINILKKFPQHEAGLLYVSDHGESLGENNIYLHGLPYGIAPKTQTQVPMVLWMSEAMKKYDHLDYECLRSKAAGSQSHDNLFHSFVGLLELETKTYRPELDLFAQCRVAP